MKKMSLSDIIIPVGLALLVIWGMNYYFSKRETAPVSSWTFVAPQQGSSVKPLNLDINFLEERRKTSPVITSVETSWGLFDFSSEGAVLDSAAFKKGDGQKIHRIYTVFPSDNKSDRFFMVALADKTPYYYELVEKSDTDDDIRVCYRAVTDACTIEKTFIVDKKIYKIDLSLVITPAKDSTAQARIFFAAPFMPAIHQDIISAVVIDGDNHYAKIARNSLKDGFGWIMPRLFGAENKYYLHTLVKDEQSFVDRGYYKFSQKNSVTAILEGPSVDQKTTWNLSFYCGPKDSDIMAAVDPRLVQAARNDGWLAPLVNILLFLLKWLYSYVHNYGWAIILLTILMKLVLFPFTFRGERGMQKSGETQKKLAYLEQKFKHDPERLNQERAEFIRKHGLPGLSGCLPLLLQFPIFFALNRLLYQTPEMYKASFLWIPDLSATDPYYVLPFLMFGGMVLNALALPANQRMNMLIFALIFGALAANFSAGLALYMVVSTILGLVQSRLVKMVG